MTQNKVEIEQKSAKYNTSYGTYSSNQMPNRQPTSSAPQSEQTSLVDVPVNRGNELKPVPISLFLSFLANPFQGIIQLGALAIEQAQQSSGELSDSEEEMSSNPRHVTSLGNR